MMGKCLRMRKFYNARQWMEQVKFRDVLCVGMPPCLRVPPISLKSWWHSKSFHFKYFKKIFVNGSTEFNRCLFFNLYRVFFRQVFYPCEIAPPKHTETSLLITVDTNWQRSCIT